MPDQSKLELLKQRIAAIADQIARQRDLIERCRKEGHPTRKAEATLNELTQMFGRLLREREALERSTGSDARRIDPE